MKEITFQTIKAWAEVTLSSFLGGAVMYLEQTFEAGIPAGTAWKRIVYAALTAGVVAAYNRWKLPPASTPEARLERAQGIVANTNGAVRLGVILPALFLLVVGCAALPAIISTIPVIDGAVCTLASEQPNEPTWEVYVCDVLDPKTGTTVTFRVDVPKSESAAFGKAHAPGGVSSTKAAKP